MRLKTKTIIGTISEIDIIVFNFRIYGHEYVHCSKKPIKYYYVLNLKKKKIHKNWRLPIKKWCGLRSLGRRRSFYQSCRGLWFLKWEHTHFSVTYNWLLTIWLDKWRSWTYCISRNTSEDLKIPLKKWFFRLKFSCGYFSL